MLWKSPVVLVPVVLAGVFVLLAGLVVLYFVFAMVMSIAIRDTDALPFERSIPAAFESLRSTSETNRFTFVCRGFDCDEVLPHLGPVTSADCRSYMAPLGACCGVGFTHGDGSEVHIYWQAPGKYKLTLTPPMCKSPATDSSNDSETGDGPKWIHCDELSEKPAQAGQVHPEGA